MSENKIDNIKQIQNRSNEFKKQNTNDSGNFKNLLNDFIAQNSKIDRTDLLKSNILPKIDNNTPYTSYNQLKVNHLNDSTKNSELIKKILDMEQQSLDKVKLDEIKRKMEEGFYLKEDIIQETAGAVLDSFGF